MMHSIVTQDGDIVNYQNVVTVKFYGIVTANDETLYVVEAVMNVQNAHDDDKKEDNTVIIAVYDEDGRLDEVKEQFEKWLDNGMLGLFRMPE